MGNHTMYLDELFEEYRLYARAMGRSPNTVTSMRYHVRRLVLFLDAAGHPADTDELTPRLLREFITDASTRYAPKTVANNVRAIKTLFSFGLSDGLIDSNPADRLAIPKVPGRDFDIFQPRDIEKLIAACNPRRLTGLRDAAIVTVLYDTGLRASELTGLRDEDVDWELGLLRVIGKGDKQRLVPVSPRTLRVVRRYIKHRDKTVERSVAVVFCSQTGDALTPGGLLRVLKRLGGRTGLHVHPHKFRHSFAVQALRNGAREFDIQASLGHTTLIMTRHYARQSGVDLAEAHRSYSPANSLRAGK